MAPGIDFGRFEEGTFVNYWRLDPTIQRELERVYPAPAFAWAEPRLDEFGDLVGGTVARNADRIDRHGPELRTFDRHGAVVNHVRYPAEQLENERLVYERGIVADVFDAPSGRDEPMPMSHYLGMLYLLSYADPGFACPVAMTAGAAYVLDRYGDASLEPYAEALASRDYDDLIEGAMFITERHAGSDVGATSTAATDDEGGGYWRLRGEKWFCSNIDAEGTLTLARAPDAPDGTAGLSLFLVPHGDPDAGVLTKGRRWAVRERPGDIDLNDQRYRRLKDKLGTISVPTGEVEFEGAKALLVGAEGRGFKQMAEMLNVERLSNAAAAAGIMGRALLESRIHAATRETFGRTLDSHPLMREDLVDLTVTHEAATAFTFDAARAYSTHVDAARSGDAGGSGRAYRLMRALVPIAKLRTGRMAVETASYAMEIQGGNGYVREFVTHRLLRDAQVLPIWEGTENILSLDVLRAFERERSHEVVLEQIRERLDGIDHPSLEASVGTVDDARVRLAEAIETVATADDDDAQRVAKRLANFIFDVYTAALLLAEAQTALDEVADARMGLVARRFIRTHLDRPPDRDITTGDRLDSDHFDAIVRFAPIDVDALVERPAIDD